MFCIELDYCCVAWCPFYIKDTDALEKVGLQRRFTKILLCFRDLTYEDRLLKYNLPSLFSRRLQFDLQCMFKIISMVIWTFLRMISSAWMIIYVLVAIDLKLNVLIVALT